MKRKLGLLTGLVMLVLLSRTVTAAPSFHVPGTLIEDRVYAGYNAIIQEGYYFLVFDNTGFLTDNFNRNHSYVLYFLDFEVEELDSINGQTNVPVDDYAVVTFNFELPEVYVTHIVFEMYASERISCFIVDYEGLAQYFEFIGQINEGQTRTILIIVSSVSGGIILLLAVNILMMRYRVYWKFIRRFKAYRNKKAGKRFKSVG